MAHTAPVVTVDGAVPSGFCCCTIAAAVDISSRGTRGGGARAGSSRPNEMEDAWNRGGLHSHWSELWLSKGQLCGGIKQIAHMVTWWWRRHIGVTLAVTMAQTPPSSQYILPQEE